MKNIWLILALLSSIFVSLQATFIHIPLFGIISALLFFVSISKLFAQKFFPSFNLFPGIIFGFFVLVAELIVGGTLLYYLKGITPLTISILTVIPFASFFLPTNNLKPTEKTNHFSFQSLLSFLPVAVIDTGLLWYLKEHQTFGLASSPWQNVSIIFFILFFISTTVLLWNTSKNSNSLMVTAITSIHFFVTVSIVSLLYPLGYGFDAFIHRATEQWIFENGFILPKTPYYIGQYSLVVYLSHILSIPIRWVDIFLVPILSSLLLPALIIPAIQNMLKSTFHTAAQYFWVLSLIPFFYFHLTTPHNIVVLFALILGFFLCYEKNTIPLWVLWLLAAAAMATHALIGAPLVVIVFFFSLYKKFKTFFEKPKQYIPLFVALSISLCLLLPLLFTANAIRIGAPLPDLHNPLLKIPDFFHLFDRPYWHESKHVLLWEPLYLFERILVPLLLLVSFFGLIQSKKEKNFHTLLFLWATFIGFVLSSFALRSTITFPDVIAYEQKDYPLRLLKVSIIFLLPTTIIGFHILFEKCKKIFVIKKLHQNITLISIILSSFFITIVLYLSYPQNNPKVHFPGFNVTQADQKAVEFIHKRHSDYNYIVLANQLVSAAALEKYSFAKYFKTPHGEIFYYAIPTGGKLYEYYGAMIYKAQKHEYMDEAMDLVGVNTAYFVVDRYWANSDKIILGGMATADEYYPIEDGKVWVFVYKKK